MPSSVERIPHSDMTPNHKAENAEQTPDGHAREARRIQPARCRKANDRENSEWDEAKQSDQKQVVALRKLSSQDVGNRGSRGDVTDEYFEAEDDKRRRDESNAEKHHRPVDGFLCVGFHERCAESPNMYYTAFSPYIVGVKLRGFGRF